MVTHPDENPNETEELEGYDDSQRAEILETEGHNHQRRGLVDDLTPDRGQSITESTDPEEQLHDVPDTPDQDIIDALDDDENTENAR